MPDTLLPDVATLHRSLLTLDTHIDIPWPKGPDAFQDGARRVDVPKMRRGGVCGGCFAAFVPQDKCTPENEQAAFERAVAMLQAIRLMDRTEGWITARVCTTADEIIAAREDDVVAVVPAVENGFAIGSDLSRLRRLRDLGARYLTLTHNGHNALADSANPRADLGDPKEEHGGLSALGRQAVAELNTLGILVDVSHASKPAMLQAAETSRTPIVATHSSIRAVCDHPRNLDDEQLDVPRQVGELVSVTAVAGFLRLDTKPNQVSVDDFADHIDHAVRRIGIEHVGISSDFDGGGWFSGWLDASDSRNITAGLMRRGYDREQLAALWSGNFLRLLREAERAAD